MTDSGELLDELRDQILAEHANVNHPVMKMLFAGELTREQVKGFVREFWVLPHTHLINNAGKLAHAQLLRGCFLQQLYASPYDMEIRDLLGESVADEMGKTEISPVDHYSCYFDLVDELGMSAAEVANPELLSPEAMIAMYVWTSSALSLSLLEILASHNFVNDVANTVGYPRVAEALQKHYGLSDKAVRWFSLHGEVDVEHGKRSRAVLEKLVRSDDDEIVVRRAVRLGLGVKWTLFDGVMNRYVNGSNPLPEARRDA